LIGDRARIGNNIAAKIVGVNGEATLNSNGRKLVDFCTFNNLKIVNTFFTQKKNHKFNWKQENTNQLLINLEQI